MPKCTAHLSNAQASLDMHVSSSSEHVLEKFAQRTDADAAGTPLWLTIVAQPALLAAKVAIPKKATWDKSRRGRDILLSNNDSTLLLGVSVVYYRT